MEENEDKKKEQPDNGDSESETNKADKCKPENSSLSVSESTQIEYEKGTNIIKEISGYFKSDFLLSKLSATVDSAYNNSALRNLQKTCEILSHPAIDFANNILLPIQSALESFNAFIGSFELINNELAQIFDKSFVPNFISVSDRIKSNLKNTLHFEQYQNVLYDARWFPYITDINQLSLLFKISNAVHHSRKKETLKRKIDVIFFDFFNRKRVEEMRKNWRHSCQNNTIVRMLNNAVKSFHRKEYDLTVCTLMSIWERIIKEKLRISYRISEKKQKESLNNLIVENNVDEPINKFCNNLVFYDCSSMNDVIPDVPGRHGIAHGWFDKYPSKKAALNAILFTDFLIWLQPKEDKEKA